MKTEINSWSLTALKIARLSMKLHYFIKPNHWGLLVLTWRSIEIKVGG